MDYTSSYDYSSFFASPDFLDLAGIWDAQGPRLGDDETCTTIDNGQPDCLNTCYILPSSGSSSELPYAPVTIEYNEDLQHKPTPFFSLTPPDPGCYPNITDLTPHDDVSSPPSLSMTSMSSMSSISSSSSSSYSYESTPMPPRKRPGKSMKHFTKRPLLPALSQQKLQVLKDALSSHGPNPTTSQSSFLAKCLHIDEYTLDSWQSALLTDKIGSWEGSKQRKLHKTSRVANWKQTIIRRGLQKVKAPSADQIEFLAAGLRIKVEQLWKCMMEDADRDILVRAQNRGRTETEMPPTARLSKEPPPPPNDKIQTVESTVEPATRLDDPTIASSPSHPSPVGMDTSDSPPWAPLIGPKMKPVDPADAGEAKSQTCQRLQSIVDKATSVPHCEQPVEQNSNAAETYAASNIGDTDVESIDEEGPDWTPEEELAAVLGPEYGHLAEDILSSFAAASIWDQWNFTSGSRQHAGGVENTPSSNSSHTPGNASSPNTSASGSSGGKRKYSGGGGDDPDNPEPNDGDGNNDPRPPKRTKTRQVRYDCPIFRRSLGAGSTVRSCALNGLEFRNIWDHLRKAHYGCETCGLRLDGKRADKTHLRERGKDASICHAGLRTTPAFDIGIDMFAELEEIYDDRTLSPEDKWKKWWKLLFPDAGEAPDPRHHDTISISTANIPAFQESFRNMWRENQALPFLDGLQTQAVSTLLERLLRTAPVIQRFRHQVTQPRTPRPPATVATAQAAYTAGPSPSFDVHTQEQDFNLELANMLGNHENPFNSVSQDLLSTSDTLFNSSGSTAFGQGFRSSGNVSFEQNS